MEKVEFEAGGAGGKGLSYQDLGELERAELAWSHH